MTLSQFRTTTALVASLALALPQGMFATRAMAQDADLPALFCLDLTNPPCPEGQPVDGSLTEAEAAAIIEAVAAETQAEAEADAQAEADAAAAEAAMQAEAEAAQAAADAAEAEAATQAEADAAQAEADAAAQAEAEAAEQADAAAAEAEADAAATEAEAAAQAATAEAEADAAAQAEAEAAAEDATEVDTPASTEPEPAPVAAAADDTAVSETEVVVETVEVDDVRSSDEDFETAVTGTEPATSDDDNGLSDLEKILLLGLGAVVVGSVLDNGAEVVSNSGDRVVVQTENGFVVYKDDDALLRQEGTTVETQTFNDGSTRTVLTRPGGAQVITIRDAEGRVLRRTRILPDGTEVRLFDDLEAAPVLEPETLRPRPEARNYSVADSDDAALRAALARELAYDPGRRFSLRQIRDNVEVRALVAAFDLDTINFETGSAAIPREQIRSLARIGLVMEDLVTRNPQEVFLIEGHTDAVGSDAYNLALSDRRAETVALALTESFSIPPENLIVQGYGERFLKIETQGAEAENRRATVRRITPLLRTSGLD